MNDADADPSGAPGAPGAPGASAHTIAFCGAGHIATVHALAVAAVPGARITKVASRSADRARAFAKDANAEACTYDDLPAGAETVLVSTPPAQHVTDAMRALQAGASVIVEKPMTTTLEDADRLVEAAEACNQRVGYAENLAYAPIVHQALAAVGDLGAIHHLEANVLQARPGWGDFLTSVWGGGVLFDLGVHPLAIVTMLASPARPVEVSARLEGAHDIDVDEHARVTLTFDTGLHAHITASWRNHADEDRVWDLQAASATGVLRVELSPNLGLEVNGEPVALPPVRAGLPSAKLDQMGYVAQLERFLDDFASERTPLMSAAFGRDILDIVCAAYQSARHHGRPEPLPFSGPRDRTPLQLWRP